MHTMLSAILAQLVVLLVISVIIRVSVMGIGSEEAAASSDPITAYSRDWAKIALLLMPALQGYCQRNGRFSQDCSS